MTKSNLLEMNNMGIVVESLDKTIVFFSEIGLLLEGRAMVEEWAGRVTGLENQSVEVAMMVTPDGHSRSQSLNGLLSPGLGPPPTPPHASQTPPSPPQRYPLPPQTDNAGPQTDNVECLRSEVECSRFPFLS